MLTGSLSVTLPALVDDAERTVPAGFATDMERLALVLLNSAEKFEVEAGLTLQITPALTAEELASLAGIGAYSAGLLLEYLLEACFIARRRQRFVLARPEVLYRLALGGAPV
jgi:hypothetical protein